MRYDFLCGLTSLPAVVFHTGPAEAAWPDIIRGGAVDIRECVLTSDVLRALN